ncbi:MAG: response regulator transcription factor [Sporolactobacillus sp.]
MPEDTILLIEDDDDLARIITDFLRKECFAVQRASDGASGVAFAAGTRPTLILLDLMLPKLDGIEVCRQIRLISHVPIIIISAKSSETDKLLSLGIGADDYMTKPFSIVELGARIKSQIRRFTQFSNAARASGARTAGALRIDPARFEATWQGHMLALTLREFQLLDFLSAHPRQVFSKEQLIAHVWEQNDYIDLNTVTVYIGRLREKLSGKNGSPICTVWGVGYKWETSSSEN